MRLTPFIAAIVAASQLAACAQKSDQITASYVSRNAYSHLTCAQLDEEARALGAQLATLTGQQNRAANSDAALTAVTIILFWPAVFWVGRGDKSAELSRLKGEAQAINEAAISSGCNGGTAQIGRPAP